MHITIVDTYVCVYGEVGLGTAQEVGDFSEEIYQDQRGYLFVELFFLSLIRLWNYNQE